MARYRYSQVQVPAISLSNVVLSAATIIPLKGDEFDVPAFLQGRSVQKQISAEYFITGGAPATIQVEVQGSNDGVNWQTVGISNNVNGDVIFVANRNFKMYRMAVTAITVPAGTILAQFSVN